MRSTYSFGSSADNFMDDFSIEMNEIEEKELSEREELSYMITGAIYNCEIENKNPLSFGYDSYYTLRQSASHYQLKSGHGVFELAKDAQPISGFGSKIKDKQGALNCRSRTIWKWYSHLFYG